MYNTQNYEQIMLLRYLNQYLSKRDLKMKNVLFNIKKRVQEDQPISMKQYNSIIKFIEREKEFVSSSRQEIFQYFEPLIDTYKGEVKHHGNDLTAHFV